MKNEQEKAGLNGGKKAAAKKNDLKFIAESSFMAVQAGT
ncbi:UNVERIFIED_ORG: hypothetical protein QFZ59_001241 [Bacillus sp. B2I3]|nr:hypothetical protein [Bacillus sp. B2I3]